MSNFTLEFASNLAKFKTVLRVEHRLKQNIDYAYMYSKDSFQVLGQEVCQETVEDVAKECGIVITKVFTSTP